MTLARRMRGGVLLLLALWLLVTLVTAVSTHRVHGLVFVSAIVLIALVMAACLWGGIRTLRGRVQPTHDRTQ